jgi:hypothetical protein
MANTITTSTVGAAGGAYVGEGAFSKLFTDVYTFSGTITDQDAVLATAIGEFDVTITGVALGDAVLCCVVNLDLDDGTDQAILTAHVSAANTVTVQLMADDGAYAADDLNTKTIKILVGRPSW